ncbi:MAG: tetratricopeptide repeat protein, partial [Pseudomonadota bacterium]
HWVVHFARGITHEREDRWEEAEADFRKALELNPGQPQVLNYLGYSFVEMNTNMEEALELIEQAVEGRPDSGFITDSLGWALYRLGRYDEAVVHMERAVELEPVDPIINDHLGDVYWAVGRHREAEFQWHRALSFEPEEEDAERIRRKLEVGLDVVLEEEGAPALRMANDER